MEEEDRSKERREMKGREKWKKRREVRNGEMKGMERRKVIDVQRKV